MTRPARDRAPRTFAIISHPDAGKTTLTEKLLLYGGAIQLAGAVKAKRGRAQRGQRLDGAGARARHLHHDQRHAVPVSRAADEPARYAGPRRLQRGHLPDAARGRRRGHAPRLREGRRGADEEALPRLQAAQDPHLHVREQDGPPRPRPRSSSSARSRTCSASASTRSPGRSSAAASSVASTTGSRTAFTCSTPSTRSRAPRIGAEMPPVKVTGLDDPCSRGSSSRGGYKQLRDEAELLEAAGDAFDRKRFAAGERLADVLRQRDQQLRPRGVPRDVLRSDAAAARRALTTSGAIAADARRVQRLRLQDPGEHGPRAPRPHRVRADLLGPLRSRHEGAARAHRREIRLANPTQFMAQDRSIVEQAYAGDVLGIYDPGIFEIGDTLTDGPTSCSRTCRASRPSTSRAS